MAIATITVDIVANIRAFVAQMKDAETQVGKTVQKIKKTLTPDDSVAKGFAAAGVAAAGAMTAIAAATAAAVNKGVEYSGQLVDNAERLGMTTTQTQELIGAMGQLGFSAGDSTGMLEKLQKAMVSAQDPSSKAAEAFRAIGVSADDLRKKDISEIFRQVVDGTSQLGNRVDRATIGLELFGKSGAKMGELLSGGVSMIDEAHDSFKELGLVLDEDVVRSANSVGDAFHVAETAMNVLSTQITADLAPVINGLINDFAKLIGDFVQSGKATAVVEKGLAAIDAAIGTVIVALKTIQGVWYGFQAVVQTVIGAAVNHVMNFVDALGVVGDVVRKVISGNFKEAADAAINGWKKVGAADREGYAAVIANFQENANKAAQAFKDAQAQIDGKGWSLSRYLSGEGYGATVNSGTGSLPAGYGQKPGKGTGAARAGKSEEEKAAERLQKAYEDQLLTYEKAMFMLGKSGEAAAAEWEITRGKLKDLQEDQKNLIMLEAMRLDEAKKVQDELDKRRDQEKQDLERAQDFTDELLFQMSIYGKTADEIERANLARELGTALETEIGQKAMQTLEAYQQLRKQNEDQIYVMDSLRDSAKGFIQDMVSGSKSMKDALLDALDAFNAKIMDMIADRLVEQLFGQFGTTGGGSAGGFLGFFGSLFGGARATGGGVNSGKIYKVNEHGPEILSVGGADYLMMGKQSGYVHPTSKSGFGGGTVINFAVQGKIDKRTQQQLGNEMSRQINMASTRS